MRILINIGHPAHVHFFKNFIWQMRERGHEVLISTVDKDVALQLLNAYGLEYDLFGKRGSNLFDHILELIKRDYHVYRLVKKFKPDIITGISDVFGAHVSKITKAKSIVFTDEEHAKLQNSITFPFADIICTATSYGRDLGKKQVRYNGYHELAYLHPNYFKPDPSVLNECGLNEGEKIIIVRFVSWGATHDIGQHGIMNQKQLISQLEPYGRVLITSEKELDPDMDQYRIRVKPERLHDLLYYAHLYIGEGATIASECAMLGTPAIYINTIRCGYLEEQEEKYGLIYNYPQKENAQELALNKAIELLQKGNLKEEWRVKKERMLQEKIDVTKFFIEFVENRRYK